MEKKSRNLSNHKQFSLLLDEMRRNPQLAKGAPVFGHRKDHEWSKEWDKICEKLNALGPPTRTKKDWKKIWTSLKARANNKLAENMNGGQKTGRKRPCTLNKWEKEAVEILSLTGNLWSAGSVHGIIDRTPKQLNETVLNVEDNENDIVISQIITPLSETIETSSDEYPDNSESNVNYSPTLSDTAFSLTDDDYVSSPKRCKQNYGQLSLL